MESRRLISCIRLDCVLLRSTLANSPVWLISGREIQAAREEFAVASLFVSAKTAPKKACTYLRSATDLPYNYRDSDMLDLLWRWPRYMLGSYCTPVFFNCAKITVL